MFEKRVKWSEVKIVEPRSQRLSPSSLLEVTVRLLVSGHTLSHHQSSFPQRPHYNPSISTIDRYLRWLSGTVKLHLFAQYLRELIARASSRDSSSDLESSITNYSHVNDDPADFTYCDSALNSCSSKLLNGNIICVTAQLDSSTAYTIFSLAPVEEGSQKPFELHSNLAISCEQKIPSLS